MKTHKFSLKSRLNSFKFAFNGIFMLLQNEHNSRIHLLFAIMAISAGFLLKIDRTEWTIVVVVIGIVFLAELFNTSLETLSDIAESEWNESIRNAKDYAAAAVLVSAIISVVAGAIIFIPKIVELFK
jgi:diacylglycerol kinase (ATP)